MLNMLLVRDIFLVYILFVIICPSIGAVHKVYVTLFLMIFDPPPLSQTVTNLGPPPLKVCHTSEQKVNKQISRRKEDCSK